MRAVLQRVSQAAVTVEGAVVGTIGHGWVVLLGVGAHDGPADVAYLSDKILNLRAFPDDEGKMNRSVVEVGGSLLVISQFTLYGDCRKGRRPGFTDAASPAKALELYEALIASLRAAGANVETGRFQAHMAVSLVNDGPVTLLLESTKAF